MKKKTKQPRQQCMYCTKTYANNDTLAQHILKEHPNEVDHTIEDDINNLTTVIVKEPIIEIEPSNIIPNEQTIESDTMVPNEIEEPLEELIIDSLKTNETESKLKEINDEILSFPDTPTWFVDLQIFANKFKKTGRVIHEELTFVTKMYTMLTSKPPLSTSCSKSVIQMALVIATNFFERQLPPFQKQLDRIKELEQERDNLAQQ